MIRSRLSEHFISGSSEVLILSYLLKMRLRIDMELFFENFRERRENVFLHERFCFCVPEIEIEGSEKCFKSIGNYIGIRIPPCEKLSLGYEHIILEIQSQSDRCKIFPANESTPHIGKFSLWLAWVRMEEKFCSNKLENCISEKFKTLIALRDMDDVFIQNRPMNKRKTVISDIFIRNGKRGYK